MRILRAAVAAGLFAVLFPLTGCGDRSTGQVSGHVQVDGKPVEKGSISFLPEDGKSPTAGGSIEGGKYSAKVPVGVMKVSISAPKVVGKKKVYPTPDSPEMPITEEALPGRYNTATTLKLEVKPGANEKDWDLQGK